MIEAILLGVACGMVVAPIGVYLDWPLLFSAFLSGGLAIILVIVTGATP